jgi:hypothetical protein
MECSRSKRGLTAPIKSKAPDTTDLQVALGIPSSLDKLSTMSTTCKGLTVSTALSLSFFGRPARLTGGGGVGVDGAVPSNGELEKKQGDGLTALRAERNGTRYMAEG